MKIRLLSGSCYIALLIAFFCLKIFVSDYFFDGLVYAFALIGTFEILRATKEKTTKAERILVYAFAICCIPACAIFEGMYGEGLLALTISALSNPVSESATKELKNLRGSDAHFSVILSEEDEKILKRLGVNVSFEPRYETNKLYQK